MHKPIVKLKDQQTEQLIGQTTDQTDSQATESITSYKLCSIGNKKEFSASDL